MNLTQPVVARPRTIQSVLWQLRCELSKPSPDLAKAVAQIDEVLERRQAVVCEKCDELGNNMSLLLSAIGERAGCRGCSSPIFWVTHSRTGRKAPYDANGSSHFANCPKASQFRREGKAG